MNVFVIILNALVLSFYQFVASYAGNCLLLRSDRKIYAERERKHREVDLQSSASLRASATNRRGAPSSTVSSTRSLHTVHSNHYSTNVNGSVTSLASVDVETSSASALLLNDGMAESMREHWVEPTRDPERLDELSSPDEEEDEKRPAVPCSSCARVCGANVISLEALYDRKVVFFALISVTCIVQGISMLLFCVALGPHDLQLSGNRSLQDLTVAPGIILLYVTYAMLLLILADARHTVRRINEADIEKEEKWTLQHYSVLASLIVTAIPCIAVAIALDDHDALEYYSSAWQFILCFCYGVAGYFLPLQFFTFGENMTVETPNGTVNMVQEGRHLRNVCWVVAVCLLCRAVVMLSPVQTELSRVDLGEYAVPVLEVTGTVPLMLSLYWLHSR